jgi:CTP:molybdopterin cytidylyltransferase MocA/AcrR family transcriptional regulator
VTTGAVILAAGAARRFRSAKQLHLIDGVTVVDRVVNAVRAAVDGPIVVVLGAYTEAVRTGAELAGTSVVETRDWASGPGAAVRAGVAALQEVGALLIVLGDLPWLRSEACTRVLSCPAEVARAYDGDRPGHPVLLRGAQISRARHAPTAGLGALLHDAMPIDCAGLGVCDDLDSATPRRPRSRAWCDHWDVSAAAQSDAITARARDAREAALTLFAERGYHGTTVGQIAQAIGLRRSGSLYNHITGKQELLAEVMSEITRLVWEEFKATTAGVDDPAEGLRGATYVYVERHLKFPRESTIVNRDVSSLEEPVRSDVIKLRRRHANAMAELIQEGVDAKIFHVANPRIASFAILEMCVSVVHWFRPDGALSIDEVATEYSDFALGIVRGPARA